MTQIPERFSDTSLTMLPAGERDALLRALEGTALRGLRLRPGVTLTQVCAWVPDGYTSIPWAHNAYYIRTDSSAGAHPFHAAGAYYLQEPSAMAAVSALDIQPGQHVLDLCAAPGGKSTQIAALLFGEGFLASNEYVASRAKILSQNTERLGVQNAIVTNETPTRLAERWGAGFDRVLVDAPCSGEGMFRREAQARAEWTPQSPEGCANRQAQILDAAADMVRPGGLLVYSTCTFNEMENEGTVERFVARHPEFAPEEFSLPGIGASTKGCLRLWPHRIQGEGHFVARLRKSGPQTTPVKEDPTRIPTQELLSAFADITLYGTLHWAGDTCWLLPPGCLPLDGLRVLRSGLCLGHRREKLFLPDHAIAMAFPPDRFAQSLPLDDALAVRYLRGETLPADGLPNGWAVASYGGLSLGWGKVVDGTLKNHLPKGLRRMA